MEHQAGHQRDTAGPIGNGADTVTKPPLTGIASIAAGLDPRLLPLPAEAAGGQLGLLEEPEPYEPAEDSQPFANVVERRGPGRPKGAVNKRTAAFRDYILNRYGDPLTGLAEVAFTPIDDLARALACTKLEAFDRWLRAREALLPYVLAKMPAEVQIKTETLPTLVIGQLVVGDQAAAEIGPGGVRVMSLGGTQQFQGLSAEPAGQSHEAQSHDGS